MNLGIENSLSFVRQTMEQARIIIAEEAPLDDGKSSKDGLKIVGKENGLADRIAFIVNGDPQHCYYIIKMMCENSDDLVLKRGRYGGIFKKHL